MEWDNKKKYIFAPSEVGVPQGGIISPILSNLMLNELDKYITRYMEQLNEQGKGKKKYLMNPAYMKAGRDIKRIEKKLLKVRKGSPEFRSLKREMKMAIYRQRKLNSTVHITNCTPAIKYIRYADD